MASSFNNQGSFPPGAIGSKVGGGYLYAQPPKNQSSYDPFGVKSGQLGTGPGLIGGINSAVFGSQQPQPQPTTPVKAVTTPDGTKTEYHAPQTQPTSGAGGTQTQQKPTGPTIYGQPSQPGVFQGALAGTQQAGQLTPYEQQLKGQYQGLMNTYAPRIAGAYGESGVGTTQQNLSQYQMAQMQGLQAGLAPQVSLAQTQAQRALGGAETVAGLTAPQPYGITSTPYNPAQGQFGQMAGQAAGGGQGLTGIGQLMGQLSAGQTATGMGAMLGKANIASNNLTNLISKNPDINPSIFTGVNDLNQWLQTVTSDPHITEFKGQLNEYINSLASVIGAQGGNATDYKTQLSSQILSGLQSGQTIQQVLQYVDQQAANSIGGYLRGAQGNYGTPSASSGLFAW